MYSNRKIFFFIFFFVSNYFYGLDISFFTNKQNLKENFNLETNLFYSNDKNTVLKVKNLNNKINKNYIWYEVLVKNVQTENEIFSLLALKQKILSKSCSINYEKTYTLKELLLENPILICENDLYFYGIFALSTGELLVITMEKIRNKNINKYKPILIKKINGEDIKILISYLKRGKIGSNVPKNLFEIMKDICLVIPLGNYNMFVLVIYSPHKYGKCNDIVTEYENNLANFFLFVVDSQNNMVAIQNSSSCCLSYE